EEKGREREKEKEVHERLLEALAMRGSGALPAAPHTEDELFLKSLLPSLQRPTQQKNFVKFEIGISITFTIDGEVLVERSHGEGMHNLQGVEHSN
ncbi:hypothetical protein JOQ06_007589, partial [Pogonophryne albipinna]